MFGFGWLEILIVAVLLLLVVGSGRFPAIARKAGQATGLAQKYRRHWMLVKTFLRLG